MSKFGQVCQNRDLFPQRDFFPLPTVQTFTCYEFNSTPPPIIPFQTKNHLRKRSGGINFRGHLKKRKLLNKTTEGVSSPLARQDSLFVGDENDWEIKLGGTSTVIPTSFPPVLPSHLSNSFVSPCSPTRCDHAFEPYNLKEQLMNMLRARGGISDSQTKLKLIKFVTWNAWNAWNSKIRKQSELKLEEEKWNRERVRMRDMEMGKSIISGLRTNSDTETEQRKLEFKNRNKFNKICQRIPIYKQKFTPLNDQDEVQVVQPVAKSVLRV